MLDDQTLMTLVHFLNAKLLKSVDYPVSTGKEAVLFRGSAPDGSFLAVKVYKYETSAFHHMIDYIEGDPRFHGVKRKTRPLVQAWARKEYANLQKARRGRVRVPKPVAHRQNVVVMAFEGVDGVPYALLKDVVLADAKRFYRLLVGNLSRLYKLGLVHGDLSEYNILVDSAEKPILIDVGQAVLFDHPRAKEFLKKDCANIARYFAGLGVKTSFETLYAKVTGAPA